MIADWTNADVDNAKCVLYIVEMGLALKIRTNVEWDSELVTFNVQMSISNFCLSTTISHSLDNCLSV